MRVAHLTTVDMSLRFLILPQLEAAARDGEAFAISAPGPYVGEIEKRGVKHYPIPSSTRGMDLVADVRAMVQLWHALKDIAPDVLHTHNPKPGVYGRVLGRLAGVPIVINTVHGLYATPESPLLKRLIVYGLEALASRFSDAELVQNPEDLELLAAKRIVSRSKLRFLGNGVDLSRFNPDRARKLREEARQALGVGADEVMVGMVGRLVAEKGVSELIEAAGSLEASPTIVIAGPGDPSKDDAVDSDVLEAGRAAGVRFLGMRDDIDAFYAALDIFVLPSHREGFPRAAMEAAASGLPLVLTDIRGCRQVVDDGVNGLLVPVGDPGSLATALNTLISDPDLRAAMGAASAARARAQFDESAVVETVMRTYAEVAAAKGLTWKLPMGEDAVSFRPARRSDIASIARLHAEMIDTGFLASLGPSFLKLLYRALSQTERGTLLVAESSGAVVGFIAGVDDTSAFYREFMRSHFIAASLRLLPALIRPATWAKVWETLRYGSGARNGVAAELLSVAIAPNARGRGLGARLVNGLLDDAATKRLSSMKVVVGATNESAIRLYKRCGFGEARMMQVHRGVESLEMIWRS
jgi:glycosyltransferase involved in cell wall biosynthesis/ribosomal protein S18 acetylase RimI-like enzyme